MAKGSRRRFPTAPAAAAVVSEAMMDPRKTPWAQSKDSVTRGTTDRRRPPNKTAEMGTPDGSSHSGAQAGFWAAETVSLAGVSSVIPSHQTSPSGVRAVLVKTQFSESVFMAFGFVLSPVPGAT